jgi:hypothetical protein
MVVTIFNVVTTISMFNNDHDKIWSLPTRGYNQQNPYDTTLIDSYVFTKLNEKGYVGFKLSYELSNMCLANMNMLHVAFG